MDTKSIGGNLSDPFTIRREFGMKGQKSGPLKPVRDFSELLGNGPGMPPPALGQLDLTGTGKTKRP